MTVPTMAHQEEDFRFDFHADARSGYSVDYKESGYRKQEERLDGASGGARSLLFATVIVVEWWNNGLFKY